MLFDELPTQPTFTLYNLSLSLQSSIKTNFPGPLWVIAEISSLNVNTASGHCYLELVDVDPLTHQQRAKMRATIWARHRVSLFQSFRMAAGVDLQAGLSVQVLASLDYSPLYGLSLSITNIDGAYTAGAMALKRQQALAQLARDGVLEMNKALPQPSLPRRIAVISSPTAAGYEDFMKQIADAKERFSLKIELFEATMQGEQAPPTIVNALGKIYSSLSQWDVVVIIRGGGARLDLSCFDDYTLASHVAQFPLPIYAGIGHERDNSVVDIVASASLKTPTATAEFIKGFFLAREQALGDAIAYMMQGMRAAVDGKRVLMARLATTLFEGVKRRLTVRMVEVNSFSRQIASGLLSAARIRSKDLEGLSGALVQAMRRGLTKCQVDIQTAAQSTALGAVRRLGECRESLGVMAEKLANQRPADILEKGYVRVERSAGNAVTRAADAKAGDTVWLRWADGSKRGTIE